ncbi:MAG TPA: monovalent cation/H(+) antiporter subunit G [Povalibacter sp.]|nr:monovalent cation/H(+) antiporter subunit G [Povalibacter sp.]
MSGVADIFTMALVSAGGFFFFAGVIGLLRFPDACTRLHALTKADNLGLGLVILGLLPQIGSIQLALKLMVIWFLVLLASATCSQLIGRAIRRGDRSNVPDLTDAAEESR